MTKKPVIKPPTVKERKVLCGFRPTKVQCCDNCVFRKFWDVCTLHDFSLRSNCHNIVCNSWKQGR